MTSSWQRTLTLLLFLTVTSHVKTQITARPFNDLDLIFLVDASSSVHEDRFRLLLQAVLNFIEELPVGTNAVNVGVVTFSTTLDVMMLTGNMTRLRTEIPNLPYEGRGTNTHAAFWEARTMMMSSFRANSAKCVIMITDGVSSLPDESLRAAEALRAEGVVVWAVGIGSYIRRLELRGFTGDIERVLITDRFDVLPDIDVGVQRRDTTTATVNPVPPVSVTMSQRIDTTMVQRSTTRSVVFVPNTATASIGETTIGALSSTAGIQPTATLTQSIGSLPQASSPGTNAVTPTSNPQVSVSPSATTPAGINPTMIQPSASRSPLGTNTAAPTASLQPSISPSATTPVRTNPTIIKPSVSLSLLTTITAAPTANLQSTPPGRIQSSASGSVVIASNTATTITGAATSALRSTPDIQPSATRPYGTVTPSPSEAGTQTPVPSPRPTPSMPGQIDASKTPTPMSSSNLPIRPTETQPWPRMSSTIGSGQDGGDDGNNGNYLDFSNLGDGSVFFNGTGNAAGLCSVAVAREGFGFAPHPHSCDKFIQCHLSDQGKITASVRLCPRGRYWDQRNFTCVDPRMTSCTKDPCTSMSDGLTLKMEGGCGLYWECEKGVAIGKNCMPDHAYVAGKGCVFNPSCLFNDIETSTCEDDGKCESWPIENDNGYKFQVLGGWFSSPCMYGNVFDLASCSCKPRKDIDNGCYLTMRSMHGEDMNGTLERQGVEPCDAEDMAVLQPKSARPLNINFRYRSSTNQTKSLAHEVLLRSKDCPEGALFVVSDDAESLRVRIVAREDHVVSEALPLRGLNLTEWRDVRIQYFGGDLSIEVSVGDVTHTSYTKGDENIQAGVCGWNVGSPGSIRTHVQQFTGDIEMITVSRCTAYGI